MAVRGQVREDDRALRAIVEGVEATTGEEFFRSLVRQLASALDVDYAFVSEFTADRTAFRTVALWGRGQILANAVSPLAGTPCEAVLNGQMAHHAERLQQLFPADTVLVEWGVHSYCGVPIFDSSGAVAGHLAILDGKPMRDGPRGLSVMRIFAARVQAELERLRIEVALRESEARLARILASAMDAIVTFDDHGRIELFNTAAEKAFACRAAEAIGQRIDRFLTDDFWRALEGAVREARPYVWVSEGLAARRGDGTEFAAEATISRVEVAGRQLHTLILRDVAERKRAEGELLYLQEEIKSVHNFEEIVGQSAALQAVLKKIGLVAGTDSSVLIYGETGTGKELFARAVHSNSGRKDRPLIKVNCAALPTGLVESELFGHEKGAFTGALERRIGRFELAHGGTVFLDEIGELSSEVQVKLLRVLQERELERIGGSATIKVDVRVIAATNRDLTKAAAAGTFRQDLYYRLNVFPVVVPPLRERRDDIPLLVHYFVARYAPKIGRRIIRVPEEAMRRLAAYAWPGNVRELENVIERAVILSAGPDLEVAPEVLPAAAAPVPAPAARQPETGTLAEVERSHILAILKRTDWRIDGPQGAARLLNLHPSTLRSRMQKLGIPRNVAERS